MPTGSKRPSRPHPFFTQPLTGQKPFPKVPAVLNSCAELEGKGFELHQIRCAKFGGSVISMQHAIETEFLVAP
jgi:hypothetical protein